MRKLKNIIFTLLYLIASNHVVAAEKSIPKGILDIINKEKYQHASWGLFAKDSESGEVIYDVNSDKMILPASTTKLFSVAALLHTYGDDFRFKTPVYEVGPIQDGKLEGSLILVAQGDLTLGGRQDDSDTITFTDLDHIIANSIPGVTLTKQDPLRALKNLAKQVASNGIKEINGDVLIDDRLFEITSKRGMILSPIMLNENLIDIVINPDQFGQTATLTWRPMVTGYSIKNEVKTVDKGGKLDIQISSDALGKHVTISGTIPIDQKNIVRTFSVKDPNDFVRSAFIQELRELGVTINLKNETVSSVMPENYHGMKPIAEWVSPPLSEYAKLILKVSHNLGADLIPLLLAVQVKEKTFDSGMLQLGKFITEEVKISENAFVFIDGSGGDENRITPKAEVQLLNYIKNLPPKRFQNFYAALPILGVDGSLADYERATDAAGKIRAKTGTGITFNLATGKFFLTTQTLCGYVEGKNGHLIEFMISVNNGVMPEITDIFLIFEDVSRIAAIFYNLSENG